jgi:proteasome lid subunit RPN8/RPN11
MLRITQAGYDLVRREAELSYPNEGCGILLGSATSGCRTVISTFTADNVHPEPLRCYCLDPLQVIAAQKRARNQGMDIIGFYHSHPGHPAQYSETDLEEAHWLDCSYVITSVDQGHAAQTRSFVLSGSEDNKKFVEEEIEIVEILEPGAAEAEENQ